MAALFHVPPTQEDRYAPGIQEKRNTSPSQLCSYFLQGKSQLLDHSVWSGPKSSDRAITKFDVKFRKI